MGRNNAERMTSVTRGLLLAMLTALILGCATDLVVKEFDPAEISNPDGVVVNKRKLYSGKVEFSGPLDTSVADKTVKLSGVDHDRVISVGIARQPFASGTLELTLDESQVVTKASIVSKPGLVGAVGATKSSVDAAVAIKEQKAKERAAETSRNAGS